MKAIAIGFAAGLLFGAGLVVSHMTDPGVVLAFLDVAGAWDPALLFVMVGAITTFGLFYGITARRGAPLVATSLRLPAERPLDARLVAGTTIFGIGWQQPAVKAPLHSTGDASRRSAFLVGRILPVFSLLAP